MTKAPQVTVIVPSLNQGRYLDQALNSIAAQDVSTEIIANLRKLDSTCQ